MKELTATWKLLDVMADALTVWVCLDNSREGYIKVSHPDSDCLTMEYLFELLAKNGIKIDLDIQPFQQAGEGCNECITFFKLITTENEPAPLGDLIAELYTLYAKIIAADDTGAVNKKLAKEYKVAPYTDENTKSQGFAVFQKFPFTLERVSEWFSTEQDAEEAMEIMIQGIVETLPPDEVVATIVTEYQRLHKKPKKA